MGHMKRAIAREEKDLARRMHRVLMNFMELRNGWRVSFTEADCLTSLPKKLTFAGPDKIRIMHHRFGSQSLDDKLALDHGISIGRGGAWLMLS